MGQGTRLPEHELTTFLVTIMEAVDLARDGDVAAGYEALLAGLHRAEQVRDDGKPWGVGRA
jgi:hypothetical protein